MIRTKIVTENGAVIEFQTETATELAAVISTFNKPAKETVTAADLGLPRVKRAYKKRAHKTKSAYKFAGVVGRKCVPWKPEEMNIIYESVVASINKNGGKAKYQEVITDVTNKLPNRTASALGNRVYDAVSASRGRRSASASAKAYFRASPAVKAATTEPTGVRSWLDSRNTQEA